MDCVQVPESPEHKRFKPSTENSVISVDSLNYDCLEVIFQYLSVKDLLQLRYLSRSLNNAVCQYLRTFVRKLQIFLDVDRNAEESEKVHNTLKNFYYKHYSPTPLERQQLTPFEPEKDRSLLKNQSHFRFEDFVHFHSNRNSLDDKISSLVLFLTTHMIDLTKLALLIHHEHHFRSVSRILAPLRKLKVFFIDLTYYLPVRFQNYPATQIVDAISGLPELESLYYFSSTIAEYVLHAESCGNKLQMLSSGENFLELMLRKLRVVHACYLTFPIGMTFDRIEEMSLSFYQVGPSTRNHFPAIRKLFSLPHMIDDLLPVNSYENLEILVLKFSLDINDETISQLNFLRNLVEIHCSSVRISAVDDPGVTNGTVSRLYTETYQSSNESDLTGSDQVFEKFVAKCKQYFTALQMVKNEHPAQIMEF